MTKLLLLLLTTSILRADDATLLRAIAEVETGGRVRAGRSGETGAWQMGWSARHDNGTPQKHLEWIKTALAQSGVGVTPYTVALAWNAGVTRISQNRTTAKQRDYAQRCVNLYLDFGGK